MFLLMKFFNVSAWKFFHSIQISGSNHQKVFLSRLFGNLETGISALASPLESVLASTLQKNYFCVQNFFFLVFWKNEIFMFVYMLSYGISTTLLQILISLRFPVHKFQGIHWCFELSEVSVHWCFEKITSPKISGYFPAKHLGWINIKYTHRPVWEFSKKLFIAAIL